MGADHTDGRYFEELNHTPESCRVRVPETLRQLRYHVDIWGKIPHFREKFPTEKEKPAGCEVRLAFEFLVAGGGECLLVVTEGQNLVPGDNAVANFVPFDPPLLEALEERIRLEVYGTALEAKEL